MTNFKKTIQTGMAVLVIAGAGAAASISQASAGGYGHGHSHGHNYNNSYNYHCFYKKVWRKNYYGHYYQKTIKVCR